MIKKPKNKQHADRAKRVTTEPLSEQDFKVVSNLTRAARIDAFDAVRTGLIRLYWEIGKYISERIAPDAREDRSLRQLAEFIEIDLPNAEGYSFANLRAMRNFFDTHNDGGTLFAVLDRFPINRDLLIPGDCDREEERALYEWLCRGMEIRGVELARRFKVSGEYCPIDREVEHHAGARGLEELARKVLDCLPGAALARTRDVIEIRYGWDERFIVLITPEAIEFRLPTLEWTHPHYAAASIRLWKRIAIRKLDSRDLPRLLQGAQDARRREFRKCRFCGKRFPPEHRHPTDGKPVCHGCAERHLGVVH